MTEAQVDSHQSGWAKEGTLNVVEGSSVVVRLAY